MAQLKLYFLGPPCIEINDDTIKLDARKNLALLAYLCVTGESHTRESLVTLLWPELEPSRARAVLRRNLSMLKKEIGAEWLFVESEMIGVEKRDDLWSDIAQFHQLSASWQDHQHSETELCSDCLSDLSCAAELYRGDFLEGFSLRDSVNFDEWQSYQTEGLRHEFITILEKLVKCNCSYGKYKDAQSFAKHWLSLDPLNEVAHRQLMQLYTLSGQRSAALRQYQECSRVLEADLGIRPAKETRQLFQQIRDRQELLTSEELLGPSISPQIIVSQAKYQVEDLSQPKKRIERVRLIGRKSELRISNDLWRQTLAQNGQTLLISGEAGIGKTRLVRELITEVETSGGTPIIGGCFMEGGTPYAPFRQIIREMSRDRLWFDASTAIQMPDFVITDLLTLVPDLQTYFNEIPTSPTNKSLVTIKFGYPDRSLMDPHDQQQYLFENLGIFFRTFSDLTPLLLVLEDIQWADSGTLQLILYLARHTHDSRIMIVVTFRDVTPDEVPYLHKILLDFNREKIATHINLPRLGRTETSELLNAIFSEEITPEFLDGIYNETEGNPFYIEEVCKALVESGKVYYHNGTWHRPSMEELGIPQNVRVAIQQRVNALPTETQDILDMAAILGREFNFDTLSSMDVKLDLSAQDKYEESLIEALENAEHAQFIEKIGPDFRGSFAFVHSLFASTLVGELKTLKRRNLHGRAAKAIEQIHPDDYEALAYHFVLAGEEVKALTYLLLSGDRARVLHTHQEAIDRYQTALKILKDTGELELAARTYMKLGLTYNNAFDFNESRQAYEDGFILWQRACALDALKTTRPAPHPLRINAFKIDTQYFGIVLDVPSVSLNYQLFCGLIEVGPDMDIVPNIAHSWEVLEDGQKYIFHLRDDVFWSDGVQVTAQDFLTSWHWVLGLSGGWSTYEFLLDIKNARAYANGQITDPNLIGVHAIDRHTLVIELEHPSSYFLYSLSVIDTYPFPTHIVERFGDTWIEPENVVTNGPFLLKSWKNDEFILLERNPRFHGHFPGNLQQVEYYFHTGKLGQQLKSYEDDQLDMCFDLSPDEMIHARQRYASEYVTMPWLSEDYIGFDVSRPPFNDMRVRRAFAMATDKATLADVALRGFAFPATGGFVPPGMPGHSNDIGLPYDPEGARYLMSEAGYPGGNSFPKIVCLARDDPGHDRICSFLETQWREVLGVEINWELSEWILFKGKEILKGVNMWMVAWTADYPDPDDFLRIQWWLDPAWEHDQYWQLVEEASTVLDQKLRMKLYQQADKILMDEAPLLPLVYGRFHMLVKPWVKGLPTSPLRNWFWKYIILEEH